MVVAAAGVALGVVVVWLLDNFKPGGKSLKERSAAAGDYLWKKGKKAVSNVVDSGKKFFRSIFS
ncbi:MAG: hypothetical protein ABF289_13575 [Clostridiales bacterium]